MGKRREQLNEYFSGMKEIKKIRPGQMAGFMGLTKSSLEEGVLPFKTKELISLAIACYTRCEYCIVYHSYSCFKAGASVDEVIDAAQTSVLFGGGPSMAYIATVLNECIQEFGSDFNKEV